MTAKQGETRKVRLIDNVITSASYNLMRDSLNLSDISTRANTDLFNKVRLNVGVSSRVLTTAIQPGSASMCF